MSPLPLIAFVAALTALPASAQTVHVVDVDTNPGADFASIQSAVVAAAAGDVILVRDGNYFFDDVTVVGKSLVIAADEGAVVRVGRLIVSSIAANQSVVIRGIDSAGGGVDGQQALQVTNCAGPEWFEDVHVEGGPIAFVSGGGHVIASDEVVFTRCDFDGPFQLPGPTFRMEGSSVTMYATTVRGLDGANGPFITTSGDQALSIADGQLFLYGSSVLGGEGGNGIGACGDGSAGGDALLLEGTDPTVTLLDSVVSGGSGGTGTGTGACSDGADGQDFIMNAPSATVGTVTANARSYAVSSPVRENGTVQVTYAGQPGDRVWVRYPLAPGPSLFSRFWDGPFVVGLPAPRQFIGTLDGTGTLVQNILLPDLGPGTEAVSFFTQAIFLGSRFVMSPPSLLVGLDASF